MQVNQIRQSNHLFFFILEYEYDSNLLKLNCFERWLIIQKWKQKKIRANLNEELKYNSSNPLIADSVAQKEPFCNSTTSDLHSAYLSFHVTI